MKAHTDNPIAPPSMSLRSRLGDFLVAAAILLLLISARSSFAGSATWNPSSNGNLNDWNDVKNWSPMTVPNGSGDTATFGSSSVTRFVSLSADTEVSGITFPLPRIIGFAVNYTITASDGLGLVLSGTGITNNSGQTQNFVTASGRGGAIEFFNSAMAGSMTVFTNNGGTVIDALGGVTFFNDTSSAGSGTFTNNGGAFGAFGGVTQFWGGSTAGNATFTNNGGTVSTAGGGETDLGETSTAGSATFTNNGGAASGAYGGVTVIGSTAGSATLIATAGLNGGTGGSILFGGLSTGGTARVEVFGNGTGDSTNGNLDISGHNAGSVGIGSLEGSGNVFLGANNLTVGSNNRSTTFSGVMQDGGYYGGTGGSLTKTGKGKLSLTNANTYTGGTTISAGTLLVKNKTGSGTGSGSVQVSTGTLGGTGKIAGAVTVGTGIASERAKTERKRGRI